MAGRRGSLSRRVARLAAGASTQGRPTVLLLNLFGVRRVKVVGDKPLPTGKHQVRVEFVYDGGALGNGGTVSIYVDGNQTGQGRVERTEPMIFADDKLDVGADRGTAVSDDYEVSGATFTGKIEWVQIDIDDDAKNADHLITPEERLKARDCYTLEASARCLGGSASCRPDPIPTPGRNDRSLRIPSFVGTHREGLFRVESEDLN